MKPLNWLLLMAVLNVLSIITGGEGSYQSGTIIAVGYFIVKQLEINNKNK